MFVKEINIMGVKGISQRKDYNLSPVTAILGKNGTSKSSIIDAFRAAMFGYIKENILAKGCQDAAAQVTFDDGTIFKTVLSDKGTKHFVSGKAQTKKTASEWREKYTKIPVEVAEILSRPGQYALDMKPEEFSSLFGSSIQSKFSADTLITKTGLTAEEADYFRKLVTQQDIGFKELEDLYKTLSEKKRRLGSDIKDAKAQSSILISKTVGTPIPVLENKKATILEKMKNAQDQEAAMKKYQDELAAFLAAREKIEQLKVELQNKPADVPEGLLTKLIDQLKKAQEDSAATRELIAVLNGNVKTTRKILRDLDSNVCPISNMLVCTTNKKGVKNELELQLNQNENQLRIAEERLKSLDEDAGTISAQITDVRNKEVLAKAYAAKEQELNLLRQTLPSRPVPPANNSTESFDVLKAELENVTSAIQSEEAAERGRKIMEAVKDQQAELEIVERLRDVSAPKGKMYQVIMNAMTNDLTSVLNVLSTDLGAGLEYEFKFLDASGMTLYGKKTGMPEMIPVSDMSTGERFMSHLLLATLMNMIAGSNFIILDNIDCLDKENMNRVMKMVTSPKYMANFANIILSGVDHTDTVEAIQDFAANCNDVTVIFT